MPYTRQPKTIELYDLEEAVPIPEFSNYLITSFGRVFNSKTKREMVFSPTMQGDLTVGLVKFGDQYRRSVKVLVARAFVDGETDVFDTPIQLDGDKWNLSANNICWRPRWFAWKYSQQFFKYTKDIPGWFFNGPILDVINNIQYRTILEAAIFNGSLCEDIRKSLINETRVFPTGERYIYFKNI